LRSATSLQKIKHWMQELNLCSLTIAHPIPIIKQN
jgi:hypothetical protein